VLTNLLLAAILLLIVRVALKLGSVENKLMAKLTKSDFDATLQSFKADLDIQLDAINKAVQAIIDKAAASNDIDFTDEVQALKDAQGKVDGIVAGLPQNPTTPAAPQNAAGVANVAPPGGSAPPEQSTT